MSSALQLHTVCESVRKAIDAPTLIIAERNGAVHMTLNMTLKEEEAMLGPPALPSAVKVDIESGYDA